MKKRLFLLSELIRRDLTARFAGSAGGLLWALVNPLIFCLIYGFVFAVILKTTPPPGFPGGYPEFLLGGLLPWIGFQEGVLRGATSVTDHGHLVKKLHFPVELLVLSSLGSALVLQSAAFSLLVGYVGLSGRGSIRPELLAAAFAFEVLILLGLTFAFAALNVFFRDLVQILTPMLMFAFYLTPILYPDTMVPARFSAVMRFNPLTDMAALFRAGLFGTPAPTPGRLALWSASFAVIAFAGRRFFRRCQRSFSDLL